MSGGGPDRLAYRPSRTFPASLSTPHPGHLKGTQMRKPQDFAGLRLESRRGTGRQSRSRLKARRHEYMRAVRNVGESHICSISDQGPRRWKSRTQNPRQQLASWNRIVQNGNIVPLECFGSSPAGNDSRHGPLSSLPICSIPKVLLVRRQSHPDFRCMRRESARRNTLPIHEI